MAEQGLVEAFNDCIDHVAAGQSIADCLRRYPQYAAALRPMLEAGLLVERSQPGSFEVATAQTRVRARVIERLQAPRRRSYTGFLAMAASLVLIVAAVFGAVESSLPGDPLYGAKRFTENVRSAVIGAEFAARRLDEIHSLLALKRQADVDFDGRIEQMDGTRWDISGLSVSVNERTPGATAAAIGDLVHVEAFTTQEGELIAQSVSVLGKETPPTATVTPAVTRTPAAPPATPVASAIFCTPSMPIGWIPYIVQPGDTVVALAGVTGASVDQLLLVNCLLDSQTIIVGQTLFLPPLPATPVVFATDLPPQPTVSSPQGAPPAPTDDHGGEDGGGDHGEGSDNSGEGNSGSDHSGEG